MRTHKSFRLAVPALIILGLSGCHTTGKKDEWQAKWQDRQAKIEAALSKAEQAHQLAEQARAEAASAQSTAEQAMDCCRQNSEKMDRMFEKAMMK